MKPRPQTPETEQSAAPAARNPAQNRRRAGLLLGCAALMALLAAVPLGWFALSDAALLDRPAAMTQPYESVTPSGDDFYLIRQLRTQAELAAASYATGTPNDGDILYTPSGNSVYGMTYNYAMGNYLQNLLDEMSMAGVLERSWATAAREAIETTGGNVYYSNDTLGFTRISVFNGENNALYLEVIVESRTGKPVSVQIESYANLPVPDASIVLPAWVQFNELDGLGDWAAPEGTDFAESGLYSARGGVLMSLGVTATMDYTANSLGAPYRLHMLLCPWEPQTQPQPATFAMGSLREVTNSCMIIPTGYDGTYGLVCKRGEDNALHPLCGYPACKHEGPACPAWLGSYTGYTVAEYDGRVYLLYGGLSDSVDRAYYAGFRSTDEYYSELEAVRRIGGEAAVQALSAKMELYTQPPRVEVMNETYTVRDWVAECPDAAVTRWWQDDDAFYGLDASKNQAYDSQYTLVRIGFDGSVASFPLPSEQEPILASGHCILLCHTRSAVNQRGLFCLSGESAAYDMNYQGETIYSLYDLEAGNVTEILSCDGTPLSAITPLALTEDAFYYVQSRNWIGGEQRSSGIYLWKYNLATGEQTELLGEELGNQMSWQSGAEQLALEPGEKPRYVAYGFVWEDNPNGIQKCVLDLEDEIITIVEDWFTAPDGGNYSVHTLQLCDGVLTGIYYYDYSERNSYISYPVPQYVSIPWQDYLAGSEDWTYIEPWDGSPNPMNPEGIAARQSARGLG